MNEDNQISPEDVSEIIDRLTWDANNRSNYLDKGSKMKIAKIVRIYYSSLD